MPTRRDFLKKTIMGAAALPFSSLCLERAAAAGRKPNLVFILADDAGYGDFSCFGAARIKTPNIDRLAAQGVRFTDAYAPFATCTPTRYSLLTGEYAWRRPGTNILPGDAALIIEPGRPTLPALMKQAGYITGAVGGLNGHRPNGPLRGTKYSAYEGGIRVPFVARWPAMIRPGQTSKAVICLIDMAATGAALAGTALPAEAAPDSFNCLPAIAEGAKSPRETLILDGRAIRWGDWKYILKQRPKKQAGEEASSEPLGELYNLADDIGETRDVSSQYPNLAKELYGKLTAARQAERTRS